jgi:hypothetical protein
MGSEHISFMRSHLQHADKSKLHENVFWKGYYDF